MKQSQKNCPIICIQCLRKTVSVFKALFCHGQKASFALFRGEFQCLDKEAAAALFLYNIN